MSDRIAVATYGPNTYALTTDAGDDDALTTFTLLDGPGVPGVIAQQDGA